MSSLKMTHLHHSCPQKSPIAIHHRYQGNSPQKPCERCRTMSFPVVAQASLGTTGNRHFSLRTRRFELCENRNTFYRPYRLDRLVNAQRYGDYHAPRLSEIKKLILCHVTWDTMSCHTLAHANCPAVLTNTKSSLPL